MEDENLDVFAKALLYLRKARFESFGLTADFKAVRVNNADEKEEE